MKFDFQQLKILLDKKAEQYNSPHFIKSDPVSIPHRFSRKQDIEIAGFFSAIFAWGQRKTILNKASELIRLFDFAPYDFIMNHTTTDLKRFENFRHRTFNTEDVICFIRFFHHHYAAFDSLESLFQLHKSDLNTANALIAFHQKFSLFNESNKHACRHVSTPARRSPCKRLNMFLRWMVRNDNNGVDFGIWKQISPAQLVIPLDVHVSRVAGKLKLINSGINNWETATTLTTRLKQLDPGDPVKYDFALFGLGAMEKY